MSYWKQRVTSWVSISVLIGGLLSAIILFFIYNVETRINAIDFSSQEAEEEVFSRLEERY